MDASKEVKEGEQEEEEEVLNLEML